MPNYKSDNLTFLTIAEMTSMLVDNTDQDGLLFAVATDSTNFKIVMWRKNSTATIDNETVFPANGPGRWHVLPVGDSNAQEVLTVIGDNLPSSIGPETEIIIQKKSDGSNVLKGRFNGTFEDVASGGGGGDPVVYLGDNEPLPDSPINGKSIYIIRRSILYYFFIRHVSFLFSAGQWILFNTENIIENRWLGDDLTFTAPEQIGDRGYIERRGNRLIGDKQGQLLIGKGDTSEGANGSRIYVYYGLDYDPIWVRFL